MNVAEQSLFLSEQLVIISKINQFVYLILLLNSFDSISIQNINLICSISFEFYKVLSLKYEAYDKMADKMLNKICDNIREKWTDVRHIALYHRLGLVPIKESSVVIAISSPHRQDSLEAVQFAIDELKRTVPIWKKEIYGGDFEGTELWKENKECGWSEPVDV